MSTQTNDRPYCPCGDRKCGWNLQADRTAGEVADHVEWMNYVTPPNLLVRYESTRVRP